MDISSSQTEVGFTNIAAEISAPLVSPGDPIGNQPHCKLYQMNLWELHPGFDERQASPEMAYTSGPALLSPS